MTMCGCESWTIKKAEYWRIDGFELWYWRRLLRVPWTSRRSNQSILKEISTEYSLEGLMLKVKLQYFGHPMQRADSFEKTLMLGKIEGGRRRGWRRMRWLSGITDSMDMSLSKLRSWWWTGRPGMLQSVGSQRVGHNWATELNWTDSLPLIYHRIFVYFFKSKFYHLQSTFSIIKRSIEKGMNAKSVCPGLSIIWTPNLNHISGLKLQVT